MPILQIYLEDLENILGPKFPEYKQEILDYAIIQDDGDKLAMKVSRYMALYFRKRGRKTKLIKKGDPRWFNTTQITYFILNVFCVENELEFEDGLKLYIDIGWKLGCRYIKDFYFKAEDINKEAFLQDEIETSLFKDKGLELVELYKEIGFPREGTIPKGLTRNTNLVHFIRTAQRLAETQLSQKIFMEAFFDEWSWVGGWPKPKLLSHEATIQLITNLQKGLNLYKPVVTGKLVSIIKKPFEREY